MKQLTRIFLALAIGIFFSCNSDDDDSTSPSLSNAELIIGSWTWTAQSENGVTEDLSNCDLLETYVYNGTQAEQTDYYGDACDQSYSSTENYSIDDNILTFSDVDDATDSYSEEIIELNATTLKLKYVETYQSETFTYIDTYTKVD